MNKKTVHTAARKEQRKKARKTASSDINAEIVQENFVQKAVPNDSGISYGKNSAGAVQQLESYHTGTTDPLIGFAKNLET